MTLAGGVSYDYDDNGNQLAAGSDTFAWDAENRLIETNIASTTGTYEYNGDGLRATRTIGASAVSYVWTASNCRFTQIRSCADTRIRRPAF
jgi:YD repeat-containing protein